MIRRPARSSTIRTSSKASGCAARGAGHRFPVACEVVVPTALFIRVQPWGRPPACGGLPGRLRAGPAVVQPAVRCAALSPPVAQAIAFQWPAILSTLSPATARSAADRAWSAFLSPAPRPAASPCALLPAFAAPPARLGLAVQCLRHRRRPAHVTDSQDLHLKLAAVVVHAPPDLARDVRPESRVQNPPERVQSLPHQIPRPRLFRRVHRNGVPRALTF